MLKVGLTGGIASGKSTVGEMFVALGARLIQADAIAHQLMQPGQQVYLQVIRHFGDGILDPDRTINRAQLAEIVFATSDGFGKGSRVRELNELVHPAVIQYHDDWMREVGRSHPQIIAMVEAALLLEAGAQKSFDRLIVVTCRPEQRIERWSRRMRVDEETARKEVSRRMAAQFPDEVKMKSADYIIDNSGELSATHRQVEAAYRHLEKEASGKDPRL